MISQTLRRLGLLRPATSASSPSPCAPSAGGSLINAMDRHDWSTTFWTHRWLRHAPRHFYDVSTSKTLKLFSWQHCLIRRSCHRFHLLSTFREHVGLKIVVPPQQDYRETSLRLVHPRYRSATVRRPSVPPLLFLPPDLD